MTRTQEERIKKLESTMKILIMAISNHAKAISKLQKQQENQQKWE